LCIEAQDLNIAALQGFSPSDRAKSWHYGIKLRNISITKGSEVKTAGCATHFWVTKRIVSDGRASTAAENSDLIDFIVMKH